jgi:hypothetical protein
VKRISERCRRVTSFLLAALLIALAGGCANSSRDEVNAGHEKESSNAEVPDGPSSAAFLGSLNEMVERTMSSDYARLVSLAKYRDSFESGESAGRLQFGIVSGELHSVGKVSMAANPFAGLLPERAENLHVTLTADGEHRDVQVLVGVQVEDEHGELVGMITDDDLTALQKSAPVGSSLIVAGAEDESGIFSASLIVAEVADGSAVSYGPPISKGTSFKELEAEAAALTSS